MTGEDLDISQIPENAGLQWMKDNTFKIGADCQDLFESFFLVNEVPICEMPDYMCLPVQCEILKNYRFRYRVVVDGNGTRFLCLFKMVEPLVAVNGKKNIHFIFTYRILPSVKGADVSEVREKWIGAGVDEEIVVSSEKPINWNFYNLKEDVPNLFGHKWMQHHRIPRMEGLIEVRTSLDGIVDGVGDLVKAWYSSHGESGMRNDLRCVSMPTTPFHYHRAYLFDGKVVGYVSGTRFCGQLFSMIRKNTAQCGLIGDKFVAHNIGHFMMYDTHRMLLDDGKADAMFVFGKSQSNPNLTKHKMELFKHSVPYSKNRLLLS